MAQPSSRSTLLGRGALMLVLAGTACDGDAKQPTPTAAATSKTTLKDPEAKPAPEPPAEPTPKPSAEPPPEPEPEPTKIDPKTLLGDDGTYSYGKDAFGELETGLTDKDVVAKLGEPERKDGREEEGATGDIVDLWYYPKKGIVLTMSSQTMTSAQSVSGITIKAPCAFKTKLGIGVGSTRADVLAAYGAFKDPEFPAGPEQFIAGSVYGGMFFDFTKEQVVSMFMGVGAE